MHSDIDVAECEQKIVHNSLQKQQLHELTVLSAELKHIIVQHYDTLKEAGIRREMQSLEEWLEEQRKGPAPAGVISESGISWLQKLHDHLKLAADEQLRLEGEGGNPRTKEQVEKTEALLKTVRRIDKIISENTTTQTH